MGVWVTYSGLGSLGKELSGVCPSDVGDVVSKRGSLTALLTTHGLVNRDFFFFFFWLFSVAPEAYGGSQDGVKWELQLLAYTTATATPDPSCFCNLHHSSPQHEILNPLSEARDWTCNPMLPSWIYFHWAMMGTPPAFWIEWGEDQYTWGPYTFPPNPGNVFGFEGHTVSVATLPLLN